MIQNLTNHSVTLQVGELTATIGDTASEPAGAPWSYESRYANEGELLHRPGYNCLWSLSSIRRPENLFMPKVAGVNFENILDGDLQDDLRVHILDPRRCALEWEIADDRPVRFHQPPTAYRGLESWWELRLEAPHYDDLTFACSPTWPFPYGWFCVFWASYIADPTDHRMWFATPDGCLTPRRAAPDAPTVVPAGGRDWPSREGWKERWLRRDDTTYCAPYFVGYQANMLFPVMVQSEGLIWLGQSLFLGTKEDTDDVAEAFVKVQENADELMAVEHR